jgi:nicotinamidase-related amidase
MLIPEPPMPLRDDAALLLIDFQQGIDDPRNGQRNNPDAEANAAALLAAWRDAGRPVIHVHHASVEPDSPLRPERPGYAVKPEAAPAAGEPVLVKHVNSAFIGTDLESRLRDAGITQVVVAGLTTDHCVSTSVRMAANLGFDVILAGDAAATHARTGPDGIRRDAETMHDVALASLHGEFCRVLPTGDILADLDSADSR